ncbi:hypothetical protein GBF38_000039 [Nibea albiflora]|nr:hypothetical protein GBF38_000039 [Nibea albiflora]
MPAAASLCPKHLHSVFMPYFPLTLTSYSFDRSSVDEEVAPLDDGASDDDVLANTSDEENDSSSISSKGDAEQPEESQDFRDAVSKASAQSGKPVIEDRLLNQILYSLPQLYELNENLLRELKERVAKWYINKSAFIFLRF